MRVLYLVLACFSIASIAEAQTAVADQLFGKAVPYQAEKSVETPSNAAAVPGGQDQSPVSSSATGNEGAELVLTMMPGDMLVASLKKISIGTGWKLEWQAESGVQGKFRDWRLRQEAIYRAEDFTKLLDIVLPQFGLEYRISGDKAITVVNQLN